MAYIIHPDGKMYRYRFAAPYILQITTTKNNVHSVKHGEIAVRDRGSDGYPHFKLEDDEKISKVEVISSYGKVIEEFIPQGNEDLIIPEE